MATAAWLALTQDDVTSAEQLVAAAAAAAQRGPRQERQLVEVVTLAIAGDVERAGGLASEHLAEFPKDDLVRAVQRALCGRE